MFSQGNQIGAVWSPVVLAGIEAAGSLGWILDHRNHQAGRALARKNPAPRRRGLGDAEGEEDMRGPGEGGGEQAQADGRRPGRGPGGGGAGRPQAPGGAPRATEQGDRAALSLQAVPGRRQPASGQEVQAGRRGIGLGDADE